MPDTANDKNPTRRRIFVPRRHTKLATDAAPVEDLEPTPGRIPVRRLDTPTPVEVVAEDIEAAAHWDERLWSGGHP